MTKKDKILWSIAALEIAVLIPLSVVAYLANASNASITASAATLSNPALWVQSDREFLDQREEDYYYTCSNNGRQEGRVQSTAEGLWYATSEHGASNTWDHVNAKFRTKEQAMRAIEEFVAQNNSCK